MAAKKPRGNRAAITSEWGVIESHSNIATVPPTEPTTWSTANAFPNLSFQNPMGLLPMPGTNKLFV